MNLLKKILKYFAIFLGVVVALIIIAYFIYNESLPKGENGPKADALAHKMLAAVNKTAWDTTGVVQWSFKGGHDYIWDKKRHYTQVKWGKNEVLVNLQTVKGVAKINGKTIEGEARKKLVQTAWEFWCNDSFWFNAVVRGDVNSIRVGNKVNIQDGAVIHCTFEKTKTIIGNNVSIGHNAIVHGCTIADNVLVGMGAIVMDNAVVEENVIIAAGAVVLERAHLESGSIYAGVPAKKVKELSPENFQHYVERIANNYVNYASWFKED